MLASIPAYGQGQNDQGSLSSTVGGLATPALHPRVGDQGVKLGAISTRSHHYW
jgi:hypothetical protein